MPSGSAIRGSRVGAGPMGEAERGDAAPRILISYFCAQGHETSPSFAHDAEFPAEWDCPKCGMPAGLDRENPPQELKTEPYKTHLAYVEERRNEEDGLEVLVEALSRLRGN
jgi:RNA polymerase-binding protein